MKTKIDDNMRFKIKDMLPQLIMDSGLFKTAKEAGRFNDAKGGAFRCPICGAKLMLYRPHDSSFNPWSINGFGRCVHFGRNGMYHGDTIGLYAAIHGISESDAFIRLLADVGCHAYDESEMERRKKYGLIENEKRQARNEDNAAYALSNASWGTEIDIKGRRLLAKRGIKVSQVPAEVMNQIGYIEGDGFTNQEGGTYHIEGVAFKLGEDGQSIQIRRTHGGEYLTKDDKCARFISYGQARCFNTQGLDAEDMVFITEGPFDAVSIVVCGGNAVATIGAGNHGYVEERIYDNKKHPVVFLSYDMDTAGEKGMTVLASDLKKIPGLTVFKYPVSGCHHDFNDYLTSDRRNAENRIRLAKGLALGLKNHLIDEEAVRSCIDELGRQDASGDGEAYCEKALKRLRRLWAGHEWDHSEAGGP